MAREGYAGVFVSAGHIGEAFRMGKLLQNERILEGMPDGIVLLDADNTIIWGNGRLREWTSRESVVGENFYNVLNSPEILGPDFCPFHTALTTGRASSSILRSGENHYYQVHAAPVSESNKPPEHLIVTVHDVTKEVLQQQKLAAIHQAGQDLADLTTEELSHTACSTRKPTAWNRSWPSVWSRPPKNACSMPCRKTMA
jgi:PAS domain S-box-containing protein